MSLNTTKKLIRVEEYFVAFIFIIMTISIFIQVVNRTIIKASIDWTEELARYCMVCMTMFGAEIGLRDGTQLAIDILVNKVSGKIKTAIKTFSRFVVIAFSVAVFWFSLSVLKTQFDSGQVSASMKIPMYIPYFSVTVGFLIISVTQIYIFIKEFIYYKGEVKEVQ